MLSEGKFPPFDLYYAVLIVLAGLVQYGITLALVNVEPASKDAVVIFFRNSILFVALAIASAAVLLAFK